MERPTMPLRINVAQTLEALSARDREEQIADLEKIHEELTIRLNRAQA
ncbi:MULTISPECIES: hypothetical protein [Trueperella]|uniref:Uncharacterized protein n=1 Tax=Trueperella abortisuis TaxID=445930 RepID=A0ABT9PK32_9ACTO|nr:MULTISPECIES: hypothetical protein [Trueperella]MCI7306052.1 hypothetical protein [Trueperella sp.]MDP9832500.1 hypothetical protein [Trueperella abortisuis]MDY5403495.1 hypothetical protein [Trueperella sp.]